MNKQRALNIVSSPVMADVTYNGIPVYIESVDEGNSTAKIYFLNQPDSKKVVSINYLEEQ